MFKHPIETPDYRSRTGGVRLPDGCDERATTRALIGWDSGVLAFLGRSFASMVDVPHDVLKRRAMAHDEAVT
jgi:hypothetical protein